MTNKNLLMGEIILAGYSQKSIARKIGISKNSFCSKINGKSEFNADEIIKICDALNITDCAKKVQIFLS